MGIVRKTLVAGGAAAGVSLACAGVATFAMGAAGKAILNRKLGRLRNRVVLITGGSRGLGLALAEEFARRGAKLALAARDAGGLERARQLLIEKGCATEDSVFVFAGDLRNPEAVDEMVKQTTAHFGRIDVLVNNAGIITVGPVENQTAEDFRDAMETNFFSALYCTLSVLPQMLARASGTVVNIASIGGKIAVPHMLPYTASKFAVVGLSQGLNAEMRAKGIRVTTVCPGLMRTGSHLNARFKGDAPREYRWFSLLAGSPGISVSARTAARKIVRAAAAGSREITIGPHAVFAARFGNFAPAVTALGLEWANSTLLPAASGSSPAALSGSDVREMEIKPAVKLAHAAALRYNQMG